jgi:uncharacterized protein YbjT (DUF2867 family)
MRKIAILSGTSGLIGMQLLHQLLKNSSYDVIISLGRRTLALKHEKLIQLIVDFHDLRNFDWEEQLRTADLGGIYFPIVQAIKESKAEIHMYSSIGTTIKNAGSKVKFYKVDHDFVIEFAKWGKKVGACKMLYVSALGADPQSSVFYNKVKGETEEDLKALSFDYLGLFQPSLLLGSRSEFRLGEEVAKIFMKPLKWLRILKTYQPIHDYAVAKAMIYHAHEPKQVKVQVIPSKEMQDF